MSIYQDSILSDLFSWDTCTDPDGKTSKFIAKCNQLYNNKYDYTGVKYTTIMDKITIECPHHGQFIKNPRDHLKGSGCPECQRLTRTMTCEQYIRECSKIHNNAYDYSQTQFINAHTKVNVICQHHGTFYVPSYSHLRGVGCQKCKLEAKYKQDKDKFIAQALEKHKNRFDYSQVVYQGTNTPVVVICRAHGQFQISPYGHLLRAGGCAKCYGNQLKTTEQFILDARVIHGERYDYSLSEYVNSKASLMIICRIHGRFMQTPNNHLNGAECPKCYVNQSRMEHRWLDSLAIADSYRQEKIKAISGKTYTVDAYDPITNTIYEFNGDFWHGNPNVHDPRHINHINHKTFKQLFEETMMKEQDLKDSGYSVVSIWESEWKAINQAKKLITVGS